MANASSDVLITEELKNDNKFNTNLFDEFRMVYFNLTGEEETDIKMDRFVARLDKLGFNKNPKLEKLYGSLYSVVNNSLHKRRIITGFFDASEFINKITIYGEIIFSLEILLQFLKCGCIVRIEGNDYFPGEEQTFKYDFKKVFKIN